MKSMSNKGLFLFLSPLSPNDDVTKPGYHGRGSWAFIQKTVTLKQRSILKILVNSWLKLRKSREAMAIVLTPKKNRLKRKTKRPTKINKCTKANKSEQTENLSTGEVQCYKLQQPSDGMAMSQRSPTPEEKSYHM